MSWIKKILTDKFGVELDEIVPTAYFEDDLNLGEMDLMDLLTDLEEDLEIELVEERDNIETIQDLLDLIEEQVD